MASLAAAGSDEEFEREMLITHAEDTFIDNLSSLKTKNLFEETALLQSLHNDVILLQNQNNPVLAVKSEKLGGVTPFNYINNLGEHWGIEFDKMVENTDAERKKLNINRAELEKELVKTQEAKPAPIRVSVLDSIIDELETKIYENKKQDEKLKGKYQQARVNFDTLKAIAMICNHAELEYNSKKAEAGSDDEFEREMLTAHAEDTFIDNLSSLKTKNLFEETALLQSLHNDVILLQNQNNPVLAVKSEKLGGLTPFNYINNLSEHQAIEFEKMIENTDAEREKLNINRADLEKDLVKTQKDKTHAVDWAKHRRVSVLNSMIDELESKISENMKRDDMLVEEYNKAWTNVDALKAIAMICNQVELEYNSKKAEAELLAGESTTTEERGKKKKKKKKKAKVLKSKDTPTEEIPVVSSIPKEEDTEEEKEEEKEEDTEPKKKSPTKEDMEEANLLIDKIVELFSYLKEKGIYKEERKKRNATFKRAADLQEKLKHYFKNTFIPLLKEKNLNFIITGGYATRLLSGGNYVTDDIDIKVYPTKQTEEMTIEQIRDETVKILKENPPEGFNSFFKFYDRAKTPADRQNGSIPFKITAPINVGEYHDPDMGDWIPISEITFTTESPSPNNIREVDGFNVSSPTVLIDNLLRAIGHNYKERIADAERLRNEKQPHESIYPGKVLSWFWQLQQLLYIVYPSFKEELATRLTSLTKSAKQGGKKTRKYKKKKRKTKRRKKLRKTKKRRHKRKTRRKK